ncbi:MAG TPA: hypothetical protein VGJ28_00535 [Micromonosporaceae bacterium]
MPLVILAALLRLGRSLWRARHGSDLASILLAVACRQLPADRAQWGAAMRTELACIDGVAGRRRFAIGAIRATVTARLMGRRKPRPNVVLILTAATICIGLAAAVMISYPILRGSPHVPLVLAILAVTLFGYTMLAAAMADVSVVAVTIQRWSIPVGGAIAATWFLFTTAWWHQHGAPLVVAVLLPMLAAAITARTTGSARAGVTMAAWAGLIGGTAVFIAVTIDALATAVGPSATSRAAGVGESLAISVLLLVLIPCLTVVAGTAGASVGRTRRDRTTRR